MYWGLHTLFHLMFTTVIESQALSSINKMREPRLGRMKWLVSGWSLVAGGTLGAMEMCQPNSFWRACGGALDWQQLSLWLHHGVHEGPQPMTNTVEEWVLPYCCLVWDSSTGCPWLEDSPSVTARFSQSCSVSPCRPSFLLPQQVSDLLPWSEGSPCLLPHPSPLSFIDIFLTNLLHT